MIGFDFSAKRTVVAGAGGGIGLAIANALIEAGAAVTMLDIKPAPPDIARGPGRADYRQGDLTDPAFIAEAFAAADDDGRGVHALVNTVGIWLGERDGSFRDFDPAVWDRVFEVNLKSMVFTAQAAVPRMKAAGGGAMVHFSSIQALRGDRHAQDAYGASKGAIISFSRSVAIQCAADGIRSNAVLPGYVMTPMQDRLKTDPARRAALEAAIPLHRLGETADIAYACLFLLSDAASFITGTELIIDGGTTARRYRTSKRGETA